MLFRPHIFACRPRNLVGGKKSRGQNLTKAAFRAFVVVLSAPFDFDPLEEDSHHSLLHL